MADEKQQKTRDMRRHKQREFIHMRPIFSFFVGAALALFASLMTMFWYVLRLFMDR